MTVRDLLKQMTKGDLDKKILLASDEELNIVYSKFTVSNLEGEPNTLIMWGYSGNEVEI